MSGFNIGLDLECCVHVNIGLNSGRRPTTMLLDGGICTAARVLAGLSQAELAAQAGVAVSVLARFEQGLSQPRLGTIRAVLAVLAAHGIELTGETERYAGGIGLLKGTWQSKRKRQGQEPASAPSARKKLAPRLGS